jgi:hypothetical protein
MFDLMIIKVYPVVSSVQFAWFVTSSCNLQYEAPRSRGGGHPVDQARVDAEPVDFPIY